MGSKYRTARTNVAKEATKQYKKNIDAYIRKALETCAYVSVSSAYRLRFNNRQAHNYTGNLINSIAAGVFYRGKLVYKMLSYDLEFSGGDPICEEMTTRADGTPRVFHFPTDWDGQSDTKYEATVPTTESFGPAHANDYINSYTPTSRYFELVLAYTADYAQYVDTEHNSLGYDRAFEDFTELMLRFSEAMSTGKVWNGAILKKVNVTPHA